MFKHRFNPETAGNFFDVINAVDLMTGRAKSSLNMFISYVEGDCEDLHKFDVSGVIYGVLAELEDVSAVLNAHFKANNNLQKQVDALSKLALQAIAQKDLDMILQVATLPIAEQQAVIDQLKQSIEPENKTVH
ncbi:MAG: hypothetical protein PHN45_04340 [Methylococcales bacterium]|nr:hypothetical protein [Methylococcales bacterium]MDD5753964.1 hypothetical protein [Methylococcales bacterium]